MQLKKSKLFAVGLFLVYFVLRILFDDRWREISPYYSYLFEAGIIGAAIFVYQKRTAFKWPNLQNLVTFGCVALVAGFGAHDTAGVFGILIPFNLEGFETLFLLLILAPVLEELLFRFALWEPLELFTKSGVVIVALTTLFFVSGHLMSYSYVPDEFKSFIVYQAMYVTLLGIGAGFARLKYGMPTAILVHFFFNLGFFVSAKM